jgi:hypothetical protein
MRARVVYGDIDRSVIGPVEPRSVAMDSNDRRFDAEEFSQQRRERFDQDTGARSLVLAEPRFDKLKAGERCLTARLAIAIGEFEGRLAKDRTNPDQRYKYTSIDAVTAAARDLSARNGIVVLAVPVSRVLEPVQFRNSTGRRLTMVYRAVVMNSDDPQDQMSWELEVANDGTQDKGHQVCAAIARKLLLLELFQFPRGDGDDHEAQSHPGLGQHQGPPGGGGADLESTVQELCNGGDLKGAWKAIQGVKDTSGPVSEARIKRLFAIGGNAGWIAAAIRAVVKKELGIELEAMPYRDVYPAVVKFFELVPPASAPAVDPRASQKAPKEWTWEEAWGLVREILAEIPSDAETIGAVGAEALADQVEGMKIPAELLADVLADVLAIDDPAALPRYTKDGKFFPAWVAKCLGRFKVDEIRRQVAGAETSPAGTAPTIDAILEPLVAGEPGAFPGDEPVPAWGALADVYGSLVTHHEGEAARTASGDQRMDLLMKTKNGGRSADQVRKLIQDRIGCPLERLPAVLFEPTLAVLKAFPAGGEASAVAIPKGWDKMKLSDLSDLAQRLIDAGRLDEDGCQPAGSAPTKEELVAWIRTAVE